MRARKVSGCDKDNCPAVYITDQGTVLAQGMPVTQVEGVATGPGELVVELPIDVLRDAVRRLDAEGASA
ncbi:hypothetical protein [Actinocrispum wychmicini]|uniref:hypothetical protein n=1 Tax=Actinocrispum wychmicini TaxID=1213861 RepID=UPI001044BB7E|nr:hypothetical protein [Actinocrispum wychmicini]